MARLGDRRARWRVAVVCAAVDRLSREAFSGPLPVLTPARATRLAALEHAADRVGRRPLLDESRELFRVSVFERLAALGVVPEADTWYASDLGRAEVETVLWTLDDAVAVAAMEGFLDPADAAALAAPGRALLGLEPLSGTTSAHVASTGSWRPAPAEWESAQEDGPDAVVNRDEAQRRGCTATLLAVVTANIAFVFAMATGEFAIALLGAAAAFGVLGWNAYVRPRQQ